MHGAACMIQYHISKKIYTQQNYNEEAIIVDASVSSLRSLYVVKDLPFRIWPKVGLDAFCVRWSSTSTKDTTPSMIRGVEASSVLVGIGCSPWCCCFSSSSPLLFDLTQLPFLNRDRTRLWFAEPCSCTLGAGNDDRWWEYTQANGS